MEPERWRQIEELFQAALERETALRSAFLESACHGDAELRAQVEKLLRQDAQRGGLISAPIEQIANAVMPDGLLHSGEMDFPAGSMVGPYRIEARIGAGGMGAVFRARDTRLPRTVAIKILKERFTDRFQREARAISALNHPHICTLYDIGSQDGIGYLVMEHVEGRTLEDVIGRKGLPVPETLRYGMQIAEALAAAHDAGVIHRDLKPGNVMVTKLGVKVLDFGLAKTVAAAESGQEGTTETHTAAHLIVGTLTYMAPEQLSSGVCDARSDIFALGLMLSEMLTGRRVFAGASRAELMSEVLRCQPAPLTDTPPLLARVVERCLARDPAERWQSARDLRAALELAGIDPAQTADANSKRSLWWLLLLPLTALLLIMVWPRRNAPAPEPLAFTILPPEKATLAEWPGVPSPDGRFIAFTAKDELGKTGLWLRPLASQAARLLPGTDDASAPFWSPDGQFLGFFAQGKLKKIAVAGGPVQNICDAAVDLGATWSSSGDIVMSPANRTTLYRVSANGGTRKAITSLNTKREENSHRWPHFLPDGRHFLFTARCDIKANSAIFIGSLDSSETRLLFAAQSNAEFMQPGLLLFGREGTLMAQRFAVRALALDGDPFPVAGGVWQELPSENTMFSVSSNGRTLAYLEAENHPAQLKWFNRKGTMVGLLGTPGEFTDPRLSPDGKRVAVTVADPESGNRDIWLVDTASGRSTRFMMDPANDWWPAWSPDGGSIAFASDRAAPSKIYRKASNGVGGEELLLARAEGGVFPRDWSKDGGAILFNLSVDLSSSLWSLPMSGIAPAERTPHMIEPALASADARFSPDGKWVSFTSREAGNSEVFVRPAYGGEKIRVSTAGGRYATWGKGGTEITYVAPDDYLMSVPITQGKTLEVGTPVPLFRTCSGAHTLRGIEMFYDVAPDGRFLVNCAAAGAGPSGIHVMLGWENGMKE